MKRLFLTLSILLAGSYIMPHSALADAPFPPPKWHGPSCDGWAICSIDPPDPDQNFGYTCFFSRDPDYVPDQIEIASIGFCQATRNLLVVPKQDRTTALKAMTYWCNQLVNAIEANKSGILEVGHIPDLIKSSALFDHDWKIYKANPTDKNWKPVKNDLLNIGIDTQITGNKTRINSIP